MKHTERIPPLAAIGSAVLSIACCLPFALPAALGLAGLGAVVSDLRPWLSVASLALLAVGIFQLRRQRACGRTSRASVVLLAVATIVVVAFLFLPQVVASLIADLG
ncbi:MAG: hypothetical protein M3167_08645 [Acidobacteriota bacterium]|nr:hypothetical protein [Acidobacteriota bacterium]